MPLALLAVVVLLSPLPRDLDPTPPAPRVAQAASSESGDDALDARRARLRERIHAMRAWRLTRALELDEQTAARLFPLLERHDQAIAKARRDAAAHRRALRRAIRRGSATDAELDQHIDALVALHEQTARLERQRFAAVRKLLTPEQAARALVLLPRLDRQLQRALRSGAKHHRSGGKRRRGKHRRDRGDRIDPFAR